MKGASPDVEAAAGFRKRLMGKIPSDRLAEPLHSGSCGVIRPETGTELSQIIIAAMAEGLLLHPPGTEVPRKDNFLELDLRRMSKILDLSPDSRSVTVQGGVLTGTIEQWLRVHGWTLGWYTPSLEEIPLAELIQDARSFLPSPTHKTPMDSVLGFHAILPDGREMWQKEAPARATGPDLLSLLRGGFSFGVLSRISLSIFQLREYEDETLVEAPSLTALLALGGRIARLSPKPARLMITRNDLNRTKRAKPQWILRAFWHQDSEKQSLGAFRDWASEGFETQTRRHKDINASDSWGPGLDRVRCIIHGQIPETLISALNSTQNSWVVAFENAHVLHVWPDTSRKPTTKDPVTTWIRDEQVESEEAGHALTIEMLSQALALQADSSD